MLQSRHIQFEYIQLSNFNFSEMASAPPTRPLPKLCEKFKKYTVPVKDIQCPQYCFKMEADFALKKTKTLKNNVDKWQEQYFILGIIISAILNTCVQCSQFEDSRPRCHRPLE